MARLLSILMLFCLPFAAGAARIRVGEGNFFKKIKPAIAAARPGDTLVVEAGFYAEGNIIVDKPLALLGSGWPVVDGQGRDEVFTIKSGFVSIRGFEVRGSGQMSTMDLAGIKVLAVNDVRIEKNRIHGCQFGIYLSNAAHCRVAWNEVRGPFAGRPDGSGCGDTSGQQDVGNGIHLWKCDSADIERNTITGQRDGIYFEFVTHSTVADNRSEGNQRYGLHFMFSHNDRYAGNTFRDNGAGVAVMFSHGVEMRGNLFELNLGASAYGLLLKEITDSRILQNRFERNSAGIYMEGANRMLVEGNVFKENGWALRVQASCDGDTVRGNDFFGNSFDVSTNGSLVLNTFDGNYWDRYEGYDLGRDGSGDVPFRPVSLYSVVVERVPIGLVLMRSFMVYLLDKAEKFMPSLTPEGLVDRWPRMRPVC